LSFARPFEEAKAILNQIQKDKTDGNSGGSSSPLLHGSDNPGTAYTAPVSELVPRRTKIVTRTSSLRRSYAASSDQGGSTESKRKREPRAKL
jgi:hypothetical protein